MAQRIHANRVHKYGFDDGVSVQARFRGIHLFSNLVYCPICKKHYLYDAPSKHRTEAVYRIKSHSGCSSNINQISERELYDIVQTSLKELMANQRRVIDNLVKIIREEISNSKEKHKVDLPRLKRQKAVKEKQIDALIEQLSDPDLTSAVKARIKEKANSLTAETEKLDEEIEAEEFYRSIAKTPGDYIKDIQNALQELCEFKDIDRERVLNYIARIEMKDNGDVEIFFKTGAHRRSERANSGRPSGKLGNTDVPCS